MRGWGVEGLGRGGRGAEGEVGERPTCIVAAHEPPACEGGVCVWKGAGAEFTNVPAEEPPAGEEVRGGGQRRTIRLQVRPGNHLKFQH